MAVLIECVTVVVRNAAVDLCCPGGHKALLQESPNRMCCCDEHLSALSFMDPADARELGRQLAAQGLTDEGPDADLAIVDVAEEAGRPAWLRVEKKAGHTFAWLASEPADPLVVPVAWHPEWSVFRMSREQRERLEYEGRRGNVEVYRDPETGKRFYVGRTSPEPLPASPEETDSSGRQALALFEKARKLVWPYLGFHEGPAADASTRKARRHLQQGAEQLGRVTERFAGAANVFWLLGMTHRALGARGPSLAAFERAYELAPRHPDVARELMMAYLLADRAADAVRVNRRAVDDHPQDAGLRSNLALALLVSGQVDEALGAASQAAELAPDDPICGNLRKLILDVQSGRRARPTKYPF